MLESLRYGLAVETFVDNRSFKWPWVMPNLRRLDMRAEEIDILFCADESLDDFNEMLPNLEWLRIICNDITSYETRDFASFNRLQAFRLICEEFDDPDYAPSFHSEASSNDSVYEDLDEKKKLFDHFTSCK